MRPLLALLLVACSDPLPAVYPAMPLPGETAVPCDEPPSVWIGSFVNRPTATFGDDEVLLAPVLSLRLAAGGPALPGRTYIDGAFVRFLPEDALAPDTDYVLEADLLGLWEWREPVFGTAADRDEGRVAIPFSTRSWPTVLGARWSGGLGTPESPHVVYVMFSQEMDRATTAVTALVGDEPRTVHSYFLTPTEYNYFGRQHALVVEVPFPRDGVRLLLDGAKAADGSPLAPPVLVAPEDG